MKKLYIGIALGILILLFIGVMIYNHQVDLYYYNNVNGKDPIKTVKDSIGVELSESVEVVEYQYDKEYGYYDIKIKIQPGDVAALKKNLLVFFESEYTGGFSKGEIPNFENSAEWWDLDYNTVENAYMYWTDKHGPRGSKWEKGTNSIQNWAFISKDKSGEYYLYISSALVIDKYEKNPFKLISKDIGLELSESMEVLEYSYDRKTGYFAVKLRLQKEEVQETERILSERFSGDSAATETSYYNHLEWWNLDEKDKNENYFLYLDKYWCLDMQLQ